MTTVNDLINEHGYLSVNYSLAAIGGAAARGVENYVNRAVHARIAPKAFAMLKEATKYVGVTERFKDVIDTFNVPDGEIPAGFRIESTLETGGLLVLDLVRDISYDKNGRKRPTGLIFSADSANPYEIAPIAPLIGNLTCNPGIVYDLFIHNPKANVGGVFQTREEVMREIGRILGPGCDISVELNNPFEEDFDKILEECEAFKEILSQYRLVVKVPHTGPVNAANVHELTEGDQKLSLRYDQASTEDALRGHNLALKLREHGYRVNYTLMFEPYQTALALQAKPYFINSFVRHRFKQTSAMRKLTESYESTDDSAYLESLRAAMIAGDYLHKGEDNRPLSEVYRLAKEIIGYRDIAGGEGRDGLDAVRHNLRLLRQCNMPDTRLIICSMEDDLYQDIDRLMADPAYGDMIDRVVITAEPNYLARFTSASQVVSYQRRFMNAVKAGQS